MLPYYMHLNEITSGCLAFRKTPLTLIFLQCLSIIYKTYNVHFALSVMLDRLLVKVYLVGVRFGMKFSFSGRSHDLNILPGNTSCCMKIIFILGEFGLSKIPFWLDWFCLTILSGGICCSKISSGESCDFYENWI